MKRVLQLGLLLGMMLLVGAATAQSTVVFTWQSGNTGTSALPVCPSTTPASCVSGYRLSMDGTQIAGESVIGPAAVTYTQSTLPANGVHSYSLVMVGFDGTGTAAKSSAATAIVCVGPCTIKAPAGFSVSLK